MGKSLFNQLNTQPVNPMLQQIAEFKKTFNGDARQQVQNMLASGRISQEQINQYVRQTNEIYKLIK